MAERVAVLGAAGYAGAVASALLHRHPRFELAHVTARSEAGRRLDEVHPRTRVPLMRMYATDATHPARGSSCPTTRRIDVSCSSLTARR